MFLSFENALFRDAGSDISYASVGLLTELFVALVSAAFLYAALSLPELANLDTIVRPRTDLITF